MITINLKCFLLISSVYIVYGSENSVIDLSHHNKQVNFSKIKQNGTLGILHKASQGTSFVDPTYGKRKSEAESQGLLWGAYHFGNNHDGEEQARHFLKTVDCGCGNQYPLLALDIEEEETGNTMSLANAEAFVRYIKEKTSKCPLIYGGNYLKEMVKGKSTILTDCPLWLSHYSSHPTLPQGWSNYVLWQYTDGIDGPGPKIVDGVVGKVDRNQYNSEVGGDLKSFWSSMRGYRYE